MKEQLISFETAKLAKEVGFNWECNSVYDSREFDIKLNYYEGDGSGVTTNSNLLSDYFNYTDNICTAPTQSLLQKWLREEHNMFVIITEEFYSTGINHLVSILTYDKTSSNYYNDLKCSGCYGDNGEFNTYEEALEFGLLEALKLL